MFCYTLALKKLFLHIPPFGETKAFQCTAKLKKQSSSKTVLRKSPHVLTLNSDGAERLVAFFESLAFLKPLNSYRVRRTDRLTGQPEGSVSRDVHVARVYSEGWQAWI